MLDLFSGIGGFSLAAQWCWGDDLEIVAFCEIDKFCQKVLRKHWPNVPIIEDIRDVNKEIVGTLSQGNEIDILTGGFPCQPFSVAGKRKGKADDRFLWPDMRRIIAEVRPRWVLAENVAGIVRMALDDCLSDLESEGYSTQAIIIPACAVNAPHRRNRVWIVAYSTDHGFSSSKIIGSPSRGSDDCTTWKDQTCQSKGSNQQSQDVADTKKQSFAGVDNTNVCAKEKGKLRRSCGTTGGIDWWSVEPNVDRVAHGIPSRMDRLKSLGNAIVSCVAHQFMMAIKEIENAQN